MDDILGRVVAILVAAAIFAGIPITYMQERAKSAEQMYLLTLNTEFVDTVCNTGVITMEMYQQLLRQLTAANRIYRVALLREQKELLLDETGEYSYVSTFYDEKDILEGLNQEGSYVLERGDFFKMILIREKGYSLFKWIRDDTMNVFYGGTVKYESV